MLLIKELIFGGAYIRGGLIFGWGSYSGFYGILCNETPRMHLSLA